MTGRRPLFSDSESNGWRRAGTTTVTRAPGRLVPTVSALRDTAAAVARQLRPLVAALVAILLLTMPGSVSAQPDASEKKPAAGKAAPREKRPRSDASGKSDSPPAAGDPADDKPRPADKDKAGDKDKAADSPADPEAPPSEIGDDSDELPLIDTLTTPTLEELLKGPPRDWLVLRSRRVLQVEPVEPRPNLIAFYEERFKQSLKQAETSGNSADAQLKRKKLQYLPIVIVGEDDDQYRIHYKHLLEVIYWDDLILRRVDALLDKKQIPEALALWMVVRDRNDQWPGLADRYRRLLFVDGEVKAAESQLEPALAI